VAQGGMSSLMILLLLPCANEHDTATAGQLVLHLSLILYCILYWMPPC
jgi:hypothetical protein